MELTRRRFTDIAIGSSGLSLSSEAEKTNIAPSMIMNPNFNLSGLTFAGTVQTTPEWYESLERTVNTIVNQRIQQTLPVLQQMINDMIDEKIMNHSLSEIQIIESPHQDLTKEQVKDLILHEIKIGQIFYPSDIADKFGLDLMIVMNVITELRKEGKLTNAGNNVNVSSS